MAVKSSAQLTVYDVTDAYNVILTSEAYVFPGGTSAAKQGSCTTQVLAFQGDEQIACSVVASEITSKPAGITVSVNTDATAPTLTITASTSFTTAGDITIPVHIGSEIVINKKFSVSIAFTGGTGTAATAVVCGNEAVTIACDKDGKTLAASTITIPFAGYQGTARKACTVAVTTSELPSGITVDTNTGATTSADGSLVLKVASGSTLGGSSSGTFILSFSCNSQTHKKIFSWSKAITGATGGQGTAGTSATSVVCGNEAVSIACTLGGLVTAATTITIPFAGYIGTTRAACSVTYSTLPSGITLNKNTAATTSADGSLVLNVAKDGTLGGATVYNGEITLTFSCNSQTFVKKFAWSKSMTGATGAQGPQGNKGDAGNDAIAMAIISSNGIVFKNTAISTVLTAHVYKGGVELTETEISAEGTIKWYKDGSTTAVATGRTLTIDAGDVTNIADYVAQLEG